MSRTSFLFLLLKQCFSHFNVYGITWHLVKRQITVSVGLGWGLRFCISHKRERKKLLVGWSLMSYSHRHTRWWCQLRKHDSAIIEAKSIGLKSSPNHRSTGCRPGRPAEIILCPG